MLAFRSRSGPGGFEGSGIAAIRSAAAQFPSGDRLDGLVLPQAAGKLTNTSGCFRNEVGSRRFSPALRTRLGSEQGDHSSPRFNKLSIQSWVVLTNSSSHPGQAHGGEREHGRCGLHVG